MVCNPWQIFLEEIYSVDRTAEIGEAPMAVPNLGPWSLPEGLDGRPYWQQGRSIV